MNEARGAMGAHSKMQMEESPVISEQIVLRGIGGLVEGERFGIEYGETVIIGRSSSCDISLKKCEKYLLLDPEERDSEKHFQTVSRKHVRISFYNSTSIEIEDLSSNGTFLDGEQIQKVIISDIKERTHELLLGTKEKFVVEWSGASEAPTLSRPAPDDVPEALPVDDDDEATTAGDTARPSDVEDDEGGPDVVELKPMPLDDDSDDDDDLDDDDLDDEDLDDEDEDRAS